MLSLVTLSGNTFEVNENSIHTILEGKITYKNGNTIQIRKDLDYNKLVICKSNIFKCNDIGVTFSESVGTVRDYHQDILLNGKIIGGLRTETIGSPFFTLYMIIPEHKVIESAKISYTQESETKGMTMIVFAHLQKLLEYWKLLC